MESWSWLLKNKDTEKGNSPTFAGDTEDNHEKTVNVSDNDTKIQFSISRLEIYKVNATVTFTFGSW
jgi:hypothetical protein